MDSFNMERSTLAPVKVINNKVLERAREVTGKQAATQLQAPYRHNEVDHSHLITHRDRSGQDTIGQD